MKARRLGKLLLLGVVLAVGPATLLQGAIAPQNVLVLYNSADQDSIDIADYYAQVHPGVQLLGLTGVTTNEEVSANYYLNTIRPQILPSLSSSISTIVTTKGLPLRIRVDEANPTTYTDPYGVTRTVIGGYWKRYSSLESELTRIDEISTWQQMGDQSYFALEGGSTRPQPSCNPYYRATTGFNYSNYFISGYGGIRLTSRLDGFTVSDVEASINRAQKAYTVPGYTNVVLDDDPKTTLIDRMVPLRDNVLTPMGQTYTYDNTTAAVTTAPGAVLGYVSHGVHSSSLLPGYITNQLEFNLGNGAVFDTHESFNAYSFRLGGNVAGQGLIAEWLSIGGAAGVGNVQEPYTGKSNEANEDQMFKMLLSGYTWGEAAWSSLQQLSYVNTVIGDPLMTWRPAMPGDVNLDGTVNSNDLSSILANYNQVGACWAQGDFDGNGTVNSTDLGILLLHFNHCSAASSGTAVPEPSSLIMLGIGMLAMGTLRFRQGRSCRRRVRS